MKLISYEEIFWWIHLFVTFVETGSLSVLLRKSLLQRVQITYSERLQQKNSGDTCDSLSQNITKKLLDNFDQLHQLHSRFSTFVMADPFYCVKQLQTPKFCQSFFFISSKILVWLGLCSVRNAAWFTVSDGHT